MKLSGLSLSVLFLIALVVLAGCKMKEEMSEKKVASETFFAVFVTPAVNGQIQDYLETNGEVVSKVTVDVFPDTGGKITHFIKGLGEFVTADQIIGYIDPSRPGQNFALNPIRSPIAGTITSLPYRGGTTVNIQTSIAKISRLDQLEIITYVAERFFSKVKIGGKALVQFAAYPDEVFEGRVFEVAPFIDSSKRTLELKLDIVNDEQRRMLEMGMFAEVRLIVEEKINVVKIPNSAVVRRNGVPYVFVVVDEKPINKETETKEIFKESGTDFKKHWVEQKEIKEGIVIDGQVEVLSGLEAGDLVVFRGQNSLGNGSGVRIIEKVEHFSKETTSEGRV